MSILSNYVPNCVVRAEVSCPVEQLSESATIDANEFARFNPTVPFLKTPVVYVAVVPELNDIGVPIIVQILIFAHYNYLKLHLELVVYRKF